MIGPVTLTIMKNLFGEKGVAEIINCVDEIKAVTNGNALSTFAFFQACTMVAVGKYTELNSDEFLDEKNVAPHFGPSRLYWALIKTMPQSKK